MTMNRTGVASDRRNIVILNLIQNLPRLPRSTPHTHGIKNLLRLHAHKSRWHTLYRRDRRPVQEGLAAPQWHRFKVPFQIKLNRLVWFEESEDITIAIGREKQVKAWRRKWKINLVKAKNGDRADLAAGWYEIEGGSEPSSE